MNTTNLGNKAEALVAEHLEADGYKIVDVNWRRKVCEIDIVAQKKKEICFVEVKYRSSSQQGSGLEYITDRKLNQLKFAAEIWVAENSWEGDYRLLAASVKNDEGQLILEEIVEIN